MGETNILDKSMRSVFVGNIPYEATEEKLKDIFCEVGPVLSFKLVYDRETGKPKGYGFCEYKDQETALSAMRNLNGFEIGGRSLRVDNACTEKSRIEMQNLLAGPPVDNTYGEPVDSDKAPEAISKAVASLPPEQMFELMKQMKLCIQNNPQEGRQMLLQNPQLAYALLQAQVVMRIVDPQIAVTLLHENNPSVGRRPVGVVEPIRSSAPVLVSGVGAPVTVTAPSAAPMAAPVAPPRVLPDPDWAPVAPPPPRVSAHPPTPNPHAGPPQLAPGVFMGQDLDLRSMDPRVAAPPPGPRPLGDQDMRIPMMPVAPPGPVPPVPPVSSVPTLPAFAQSDLPSHASRDPRDRFSRDPRTGRGGAGVPPPGPVPPVRPTGPSFNPNIPSGASDQEKAALIMQVLQLSDEQIAMLSPEQRQSILVLKEQIAKSTQRQ